MHRGVELSEGLPAPGIIKRPCRIDVVCPLGSSCALEKVTEC